MRELKPEELRVVCDPASLSFHSTEELPPLDGMIGQERALSATTFGVGVKHSGYNLFVLGPPATGKTTTMRRVLARAAADQPVGCDYCYVHNFADPYRPSALEMPAGRGRELAGEMARLVEECKARLPRAFEGEEFERQKSQILERLGQRQEAEIGRLEETARQAGFVVLRSPTGLAVAPAPRGKPLSREEFDALPEATRERLTAGAGTLQEAVEESLRRLRQLERDAPAGASRGPADGKPALPFLPAPGAFLDRYRVNVLVDRSGEQGAPVVFEQNPTYANLVGRLEHRAHFGTLVTDFTLIKAGALHRANGGYLILGAKDA